MRAITTTGMTKVLPIIVAIIILDIHPKENKWTNILDVDTVSIDKQRQAQ